MAEYRLAPRARADLRNVWRRSVEHWGRAHADKHFRELLGILDLIAQAPGIARLRKEIDPPVRLHPHGPQLIIYRDGPPVEIVRILHHRQDWMSRL